MNKIVWWLLAVGVFVLIVLVSATVDSLVQDHTIGTILSIAGGWTLGHFASMDYMDRYK